MERLTISRGSDSLGVTCDPDSGVVTLEGSSYPEDAFAFFEPVVSWVEGYLADGPPQLRLVCTIDYLSSSSSKSLFDMLDMIAGNAPDGCDVQVVWRYETDDPDAREVGEEFAEDVDIPFVFETIG